MVYWPNDSKLPAVYDVSTVAQFDHVQWAVGPLSGAVFSTTYIDGKLYFLTYKVDAERSIDKIVCMNPADGETLWEYESGLPIDGGVTFSEDKAYYIEGTKRLVARSLNDRQEKWHYDAAKRVRTLPVVNGNTVYVGSLDKGLHAVDTDTGEGKWVFYTRGEIRSPAGVGPDGTVYVGSFDTRIYAVDPAGKMKWYYRPEEKPHVYNVIHSRPAIAYETVYFGSNNFYLYALDCQTGREKWKFCGGIWIRTFPVVHDGKVYLSWYSSPSPDIPYTSNTLYCLDAHTGEVAWCKHFADIFHGPYIADGRVFICCQDGIFRALNIGTGEEEWRFGTEGGWVFDPAFADGYVYVPSSDQVQPVSTYPKLYALATVSKRLFGQSSLPIERLGLNGHPRRVLPCYSLSYKLLVMTDTTSRANNSRSTILTRMAPAKINLCLEITGKREDSYHNITSVMQAVDLHDILTFAPADDGELTLECDDPVLVAEGQGNLVLKAARLLRTAAGLDGKVGAHITLEKRIPMSAGLGGGSSDAAATLLGLRDLWRVKPGTVDLLDLAEQLGSDVPFFLDGRTALVEGRGERVTRIPSPPAGWVVLVCPRYNMADKTKKLYSSLTSMDMSEGIVTHRLIAALVAGRFPDSSLLYNAFERVAYEVFEGLDRVRQKVAHAAGCDVHLSGSGPSLYVLYPASQERAASRLYDALVLEGMRVYLAGIG